jgi:hypothetical protein
LPGHLEGWAKSLDKGTFAATLGPTAAVFAQMAAGDYGWDSITVGNYEVMEHDRILNESGG